MRMKPNHITMTRLIKNCFNPSFLTLLVLAGLMIIPTTVSSQYNCVCGECGRPCGSGHAPSCSSYVSNTPTPGTSRGSSGSSNDLQMQTMQSMLQPFFNTFFASLFAPPDDSHQQELVNQTLEHQRLIKQQEEQKRLAAEQAKKAALERWLQLQSERKLQAEMEQGAKIAQGAAMLSQMQTVGGGGKLEPFSVGSLTLDLKPLDQKTYPTADLKAWPRLLCAAYFSNLAKQSTKDLDATFYADQAERVMSGEPTYLECKIPQVSNEKVAKRMKEVEKMHSEMGVKLKELQDIEFSIIESKEKTRNAELKKEEATTRLNELQTHAATTTPEEKSEMDKQYDDAMKQLHDAEQELIQANQSERDVLNKREQVKNELGNMRSQMQAMMQARPEE